MRKQHSNRSIKRKRTMYLRRFAAVVVGLCICAALNIAYGAEPVVAEDAGASAYKYYKSVEIDHGDTLWNIAREYKNDSTDIRDYIQDLKDINHLTSDDIHAEKYLTVAYYDTRRK